MAGRNGNEQFVTKKMDGSMCFSTHYTFYSVSVIECRCFASNTRVIPNTIANDAPCHEENRVEKGTGVGLRHDTGSTLPPENGKSYG